MSAADTAEQATIADLPPSCKLVALALRESDEGLAQGDLETETLLNARTVRYALNRLEEAGAVTHRTSLKDARRRVYQLADDVDPWGGEQA